MHVVHTRSQPKPTTYQLLQLFDAGLHAALQVVHACTDLRELREPALHQSRQHNPSSQCLAAVHHTVPSLSDAVGKQQLHVWPVGQRMCGTG